MAIVIDRVLNVEISASVIIEYVMRPLTVIFCMLLLLSSIIPCATPLKNESHDYNTVNINVLADSIIENYGTRSRQGNMCVLFMYVRDNIAYEADDDYIRTPLETVNDGVGGSFDQSRLLCALFYAIEKESYYVVTGSMGKHRFVAVQLEDGEATYMSSLTGGHEHFFSLNYLDEKLVFMDPTMPMSYIGWTPYNYTVAHLSFEPSSNDYFVTQGISDEGAMSFLPYLVLIVALIAVVIVVVVALTLSRPRQEALNYANKLTIFSHYKSTIVT